MDIELLRNLSQRSIALDGGRRQLCLAGRWFLRGRLLMHSPDSLGTACPLSGKNSTYRPVQILEADSPGTRGFSPGMALGANCFYSDGRIGYGADHAALDVNIPNYASAIVTTNKIVDLVSSVQALEVSAQ